MKWLVYLGIIVVEIVFYNSVNKAEATILKQYKNEPTVVARWDEHNWPKTIYRINIPEDKVSCYILEGAAWGLRMSCIGK